MAKDPSVTQVPNSSRLPLSLRGEAQIQRASGNLVWFEVIRIRVGRLETSSSDERYSRREDEGAAEFIPRQMPTHLIRKLPCSSQKIRYRHWESSPISTKSFHLVSVSVGIRQDRVAGWKRMGQKPLHIIIIHPPCCDSEQESERPDLLIRSYLRSIE